MDRLNLSLKEDKNFLKLQDLVTELLKSQPDEEKVKQLMLAVGLEYSEDPIKRMNLVLQTLHKK